MTSMVVLSDRDYVVSVRRTMFRRARLIVVGPVDVPEPTEALNPDDPESVAYWRTWRRRMVRVCRDLGSDALRRSGLEEYAASGLPLDREGWMFMLDGTRDVYVKIKE